MLGRRCEMDRTGYGRQESCDGRQAMRDMRWETGQEK